MDKPNPKTYTADFVKKKLNTNPPEGLQSIKNAFMKENNFVRLSYIDDAFIQQQFLEECSKLFLQETQDYLKNKLKKPEAVTFLQTIFNIVSTAKKLAEITSPLNNLKYYKLLIADDAATSENEERELLSKFKNTCLQEIMSYSDFVEQELNFLDAISDFLSVSVIAVEILPLNEFCKGTLKPQDFVKAILDLSETIGARDKWKVAKEDVYQSKLKKLKEAARFLVNEKQLIFQKTFVQIFKIYVEPTKIDTKYTDGRKIVEVSGKFIVVDQVLSQVEYKLRVRDSIEEVRFVGSDILYINADFGKSVWHGINIAVYARSVLVSSKSTWDVSGLDNNNSYSGSVGTTSGGLGIQGKDGYAGESGGNVLFICDTIDNAEDLTVISNGGAGSRGQDGGNGTNGSDGEAIDKSRLTSDFPSPVKSFYPSWDRPGLVENVVNNVKKIATLQTNYSHSGDRFVKATTSKDAKITFSYYKPGFFESFQGYFAFQGSPGSQGREGGEPGLGGDGGFPGEIVVPNRNVVTKSLPGKRGENGLGGFYGTSGKNGWDIGYIDHQSWANAKFYGTNCNQKINLAYRSGNSSERVWCAYNGAYCEMDTEQIKDSIDRNYKVRKTVSQDRKLQEQGQATKKKTITKTTITSQYSHLFDTSTQKSELEKLRQKLKDEKKEALDIYSEVSDEVKINTQIRIQRQARTPKFHRLVNRVQMTVRDVSKYNFNRWFGDLKNNKSSKEFWMVLKTFETTWSEISRAYSSFQSETSVKDRKDIDDLFRDKFTFAALQEVARKTHPTQSDENLLSDLRADVAARFLVNSKSQESFKIVEMLNNFDSFKASVQIDTKSISESLKRTIALYVLEVGDSKYAIPSVKKWFSEYFKFAEERKKIVSVYFEALINVLQDSSASLSNIEQIVERDPLVRKIYNRYRFESEIIFDWSESCRDASVIDACQAHMLEKGVSAPCTREFLAGNFNINLRLYGEDAEKSFVLLNDHNASSVTILYVLWKDNKFTLLDVDVKYLDLAQKRVTHNNFYADILMSVRNLKTKPDFDDFVKNPVNRENKIDFNKYPRVFKDDVYIEKILEFFSEDECKKLKKSLDAIRGENIGTSEILRQIYKKFSSDGRDLEFELLQLLINCIITSTLAERYEIDIFLWIIESQPQSQWVDFLLVKIIENYYKKKIEDMNFEGLSPKPIDKHVLLLFCVKFVENPLPFDDVLGIFKLLTSLEGDLVKLDDFDLTEWHYALKSRYWVEKLKYFKHMTDDDLEKISEQLLSLENVYNSTTVEQLLTQMINKNIDLSSDDDTKIFSDILTRFQREDPRLSDRLLKETLTSNKVSEWCSKIVNKYPDSSRQREIAELAESVIEDPNTSKAIRDVSSKAKSIILNMKTFTCPRLKKPLLEFTEGDIRLWVREKHFDSEKPEEIFTVIYRAIELKHKICLRDTQKYTILLLLLEKQNTLCQMATGEGKSFVIVALAIFKALKNEKVDVITSSSVLAKRDAQENADIYEVFGIQVAHNCTEDMEERKNAYSNNQVVYGDLSNFQRDYLLDKFYRKNILGDRSFTNLILDEVDSMLLDKGNNILYLSQDLVGMDKLESLYVYIWQRINQPVDSLETFLSLLDVDNIKKSVLYDLYGLIEKHEIKTLGFGIEQSEIEDLWKLLIENKIIDNQGLLIVDKLPFEDLLKAIPVHLSKYDKRLYFFLEQRLQRETSIKIPNYLKPFVLQHLESWIKSAITASQIQESFEYTVDVDRSRTTTDRNAKIIILDLDTGTDLLNSQWDEGLHQFLQIKHGCRLTMQSLKSVFISNVTYFKLYNNLYGLTGTLGSHTERALLDQIYTVDFFTMPTAKPKRFKEEPPVLCRDTDEWLKMIVERAQELTKSQRPGLIIAETIAEVHLIYKKLLLEGFDKRVFIYERDFERFDLVQSKGFLGAGEFIVSTNLVCRGVNVGISKEVNDLGGLHVILTYLPYNSRIEFQGFGRGARKGQNGSGQLIVRNPKSHGSGGLIKMLQLKKDRDMGEYERIASIRNYYQIQILSEEACFKEFSTVYKSLCDRVAKLPEEVKGILLQSCLDRWAFWLDQVQTHIKNKAQKIIDELLKEFLNELQKLTCDSDEDYKAWIATSPVLFIKLSNYYIKQKNYSRALTLLDEVIKKEPFFSESAHYYKSYIFFKQGDLNESKHELSLCDKYLDHRSDACISSASFINTLRKYNERSMIQIDAFKEQKQGEMNIYSLFKKSIYDILGHPISPQSFVTTKVDKKLGSQVYDIFTTEKIFTDIKIHNVESALKTISKDFGLRFDDLKRFLQRSSIDCDSLLTEIKAKIRLPCREDFWEVLKKNGVLHSESLYCVVNKDEFEAALPDLKIADKAIQFDLKSNEVLLYYEILRESASQKLVFEESVFKFEVGEENYNYLAKNGMISLNKKATLEADDLNSLKFAEFDEIAKEDFTIEEIPAEEIDDIVAELVKKKILAQDVKRDCYKLITDFRKVSEMKLSTFGVYEDSIKLTIFNRFSYRIAVQKIAVQIQEKSTVIAIELMPNAHSNLVSKLFEARICEAMKITPNFDNSEKNLEKIFKKHGKSVNEEIAKDISKTIKQLRSSLENFEEADCKLESLLKYFENLDNSDTALFILDGFDKVLELEEAKWTLKMILSSVGVLLIAVAEIAIGAAIEVFSAGTASYFGMAFIGEGISDIFYSVNSFRTGYFSWEDYGQYKAISLCITAVSFGVGGLMSKGLRFAKVAAATTWKAAGTAMAKVISVRLVQGLANAAVYVGIDLLIENCLQKLCENISSSFLVNIDDAVDESQKFSDSLDRVLRVLDESDAKKFLGDLYNARFANESLLEKILPISNQAVNSVLYQIAHIKNTLGNKKVKFAFILAAIVTEVVVNSAQLLAFRHTVKNICDDLADEIERNLKNKPARSADKSKREKFKNDARDQLKTMLKQKSAQVIHQSLLNPIFQAGSTLLMNYVSNVIGRRYDSFKDSKALKEFEKKKEEYYQHIEGNSSGTVIKIDETLMRDFHKKVLEFESKLRTKQKKEIVLRELIKIEEVEQSALKNSILKKVKTSLDKLIKESTALNAEVKKPINEIKNKLRFIKDKALKEHLTKILQGETSNVKIDYLKLNASDLKIISSLSNVCKSSVENAKSLYNRVEAIAKQRVDFEEMKIAYKKILDINSGVKRFEFESASNLLPEVVLTMKYVKDDVNDPSIYSLSKRMNTVAGAVDNEVLYLACNYHVEYDSGRKDKTGKPIMDIKNIGWTPDTDWISTNLKNYCRMIRVRKIVFIEPEVKPTTRPENRAPHAEMQLLAYARENGFKLEGVDVSKPPCVSCLRVLDENLVKYLEIPGNNLGPKNWLHPSDIRVKEVGFYDFSKDFKPFPPRVPIFDFERAKIVCSWLVVDDSRVLPKRNRIVRIDKKGEKEVVARSKSLYTLLGDYYYV